MVKIRLRRMGKTKQPSYRIVVADSRSPRDGKFIEIIGHYNPIRQPKILEIKPDRARYWVGVGAQLSDTVTYLFKKAQILDSAGKVIPLAPPSNGMVTIAEVTSLEEEDEDEDMEAVSSMASESGTS